MITTKNKRPPDGGLGTIKGRAAHLVQALENCPLEFTVEALTILDKYNSRGAKSPSARRWIREFCGFEGKAAHEEMDPIIEVINDGHPINDRGTLIELMKEMKDVA